MLHKYLLNEPDHSDEKEPPLFSWAIGFTIYSTACGFRSDKFIATVYVFLTHCEIPVAILRGGQKDPSIFGSTSGLKGPNQNSHHIPSGTHW